MAAFSSSFCGVDPSQYKYDVFISFRGGDTRHHFTAHLYSVLCRYQVKTYIDEMSLQKEDDISRALPKAIEESAISIIIFSTNYASSTWCLDELIQILKCKKEKDQIVLPIFLGVDPLDVREQKSSYADAFVKHEQRFNNRIDKVQEWRQALIEASGLSGWDSWGRTTQKLRFRAITRSDSELVEAVVQDVLRRLCEIWSTSIDTSNGLLGGAFLSAFVEDLFRRFRSQDFVEFLEEKFIQELVKAVETELISANMVLNDAEEKQVTNAAVKEWLDHLGELIFRADDLTENINYEVLIRKLRRASESSTSIATFGKSSEEERELEGINYEFQLDQIISKLQLLIARKDILGLISLRSYGEPLVLESDVYGREYDKEATIKLVQSDNKAMVVPIVGREAVKKAFKPSEPDVYNVYNFCYSDPFELEVYGREAAKEAFKPDVYGREAVKKAFTPSKPDIYDVYGMEAFKPEVYGSEAVKKAFTPSEPDVYGREDAKKADLNAHPDLLSIIGAEMGDIGETNLGEYLIAHPNLQRLCEEIVSKCKGHPIAVKSVVALLCSIPSPDERRKILENHIWHLKLQKNASKRVFAAQRRIKNGRCRRGVFQDSIIKGQVFAHLPSIRIQQAIQGRCTA